MINRWQFCEHIIRPTLKHIGFYSLGAEKLLLHTAIIESRLIFLKQVGGPALGIYQMEPATHKDIWLNYLQHREELSNKVNDFSTAYSLNANEPDTKVEFDLIHNLAYATAMARVHYLRVPAKLPEWDDIRGQGKYWKTFYNTHLGKGTEEKFVTEISALYPEGIRNDV